MYIYIYGHICIVYHMSSCLCIEGHAGLMSSTVKHGGERAAALFVSEASRPVLPVGAQTKVMLRVPSFLVGEPQAQVRVTKKPVLVQFVGLGGLVRVPISPHNRPYQAPYRPKLLRPLTKSL